MSLVLHCGARALTRDQLEETLVPMPIGPKHETRPFIDDVELVSDYLSEHGLSVTQEAYGVKTRAVGGHMVPFQFFGLMELRDEGDFALMVGLRGSYDQSLPRGIAVGSRVFVCDNLAFSGEVDLHTKQTLNIDERMPRLVARACERIPLLAERQHERFADYRRRALTLQQGDAMIAHLFRHNVLNKTTLPKTLDEWNRPRHSEFAHERNLWGLHNAVTEAIKGDSLKPAVLSTWSRTLGLTKLLDEALS